MTDDIRVKDLMLTDFVQIGSDQTLGAAMEALLEAQAQASKPNALVVLDGEGRFAGLLTSKLLARSLLALWMPSAAAKTDEDRFDEEVMSVVQDRLQMRVHDALIRGLPVVAPHDRLLTVIRLGSDTRLDFVPVVDDGKAVGLVPVTKVFQAAASIALTPEHEGIRFDQKP